MAVEPSRDTTHDGLEVRLQRLASRIHTKDVSLPAGPAVLRFTRNFVDPRIIAGHAGHDDAKIQVEIEVSMAINVTVSPIVPGGPPVLVSPSTRLCWGLIDVYVPNFDAITGHMAAGASTSKRAHALACRCLSPVQINHLGVIPESMVPTDAMLLRLVLQRNSYRDHEHQNHPGCGRRNRGC